MALNSTVPSLATMTKGALNVLDNDKDGFVLMIEGGAIDWAAHANQTGRTIEEEMDFNASVEAVIAWVEQVQQLERHPADRHRRPRDRRPLGPRLRDRGR